YRWVEPSPAKEATKDMFGRKAVAIATASVFGLGLLGSAAVAALAPVSTDVLADQGTAASVDAKGPKSGAPDKFKAILDALVAKGVITQAQADKAKAGLSKHITEFVDHVYTKVERKPVTPKVEMFIGDAVSVAGDYLGVPATDLGTALRSGKSLGEIADGIPGKNRQGLINAMTAAANAKINKAAAENKITAEQAATLNANVVAAVTKL